ncbi:MAG: helix-turn-helix domain-containing protein [Verrucomicrobia bacterium]|nr:helix-turn-helix domain-containing protein [Verrucomicrobiota bacterium]MCH8529053.1 helix-turn-helix domain-containing protein [Kiritimatiellia bacterium]
MNSLPTSQFSTASLPRKDRFAAWRESIEVLFEIQEVQSANEADFFADLHVHRVGEMLLARLESQTARYVRPRERIIRDGVDILMIQFFLEGEVLFRTGNDSTRGMPGDLIVFDFARPLDNINSRFRNLSLLAPRDRLEAYVPGIARYHGRPLPRDLPGVNILREHLLTLHSSAGGLPDSLADPLSDATFSLVAAAFSQAPGISRGIGDPASPAVGASLIPRIRRHIHENLASNDLSPVTIARHFGVSKAQLYRVMEPVGGVAAFIRQQRLRACRRDLHNSALRHLRIAEIAYRHGFTNIASFNRQFRQEFGCAPGDARATAPDILSDIARAATSPDEYQDWIRLINAVGGQPQT